ncbi:MAG: arsenate reductase (glutaredoxin) [Candidatus Brevundimonas phytovorans]|nr:arsenate reductase (glutaredoxin) [Brevundimonas sp.]WEK56789.1 MAG: arsenate reductase (glutaredoxin) [Brevundimonas sp.]
MTVTIFHNPKCSTSRKALELLLDKGVQPTVVEYLKTGWDAATLDQLAKETGVGLSGMLRKREAKTAELLESGASEDVIRAAMIADPVLVERPIVQTAKGARIGRPVESILDIL